MSAPRKVLITKQPQTGSAPTTNSYENDGFLDDYHDGTLPTNRTMHSASDVDLIRTRDLNRQGLTSKTTPSWYTSPRGLLIAAGGLLILAALVVVPTVLGVILTRNPTLINNSSTTTAATTGYTIYWSFDYTPNDTSGTYSGALVNSPTYSNTTYFGYGSNLLLSSSLNQSMIISSPFFNLSYTSFTVEVWIYGTTLTGDNPVFSQCQCTSCQDQCLYLIIRNYKMYMGFSLDDLVGLTSLSINTWYHIAYVYDYTAQTQFIYIQGVLDNSKTSAGPYQGRNGSIIIGGSLLSSTTFNGYIDNLKVTTRAKSATELLAAATVVVYYSFDGSSLTQDLGPNQMNGSLSNAGVVTGRVGQALAFSGSLSYLQIYGFYQLGQSSKAFSFAMWLYPYSVTGGTVIHKSSFQISNSSWCQDMMAFTYGGQIAFHINGANPQITGPFMSTMQWTHLVFTYSSTNGQTLYVNGAVYLTAAASSFSSSSTIDWLTIGYNFGGCNIWAPEYGGYYFGAIDEFYVFRRELSASDAYSLANP